MMSSGSKNRGSKKPYLGRCTMSILSQVRYQTLKVNFLGEEAVYDGGLHREFLRLQVKAVSEQVSLFLVLLPVKFSYITH